jgi:hypothetical protein
MSAFGGKADRASLYAEAGHLWPPRAVKAGKREKLMRRSLIQIGPRKEKEHDPAAARYVRFGSLADKP